MAAPVCKYSDTFPMQEATYLVGLLTQAETFDLKGAVCAARQIIDYLLGQLLPADGLATAKVKCAKLPPRTGRKAIAQALQAMVKNRSSECDVNAAAAFPTWLIPILLRLVADWLDGKR